MKSYNEMAQNVLSLISEYNAAKARKRMIVLKTAVPAFCICAVIAAGIAIHTASAKGHTVFDKTRSTDRESPASVAESAVSSDGDGKKFAFSAGDRLGVVIVNGISYGQDCSDYVIEETYTADRYLGDARELEGSYNKAYNNMSAELYSVKESKNVLLIKLGNGGRVVLVRNGELCVNGKDYCFSESQNRGEIKEKCLGKAKQYIIDVPTRENNVSPYDEIWTVKGSDNKLIAEKADGTEAVFSVAETIFVYNPKV